jgi:GNAT superfamily N-acetyltransferase
MMRVAQIEIRPIEYSAVHETKELFGSSGNLPFQYHSALARDRLVNYHYKKSCEALAAGKLDIFGATVEARPLGLLLLEHLPWDTEVLGVNCYGIRDLICPEGQTQDELVSALVKFAIDRCRSKDGRLLVAKTDPAAQYIVRALGLAGFEHVSTLVFFAFDMRRVGMIPVRGPLVYRPFEDGDLSGLEDVAQKSFADHFDRFTSDPRIPHEGAKRVHSEWVKNSCRGYADQVFVGVDGGRVIAFGTWKLEKGGYEGVGARIARYDLGAVSPDYWGKGVFKDLTATAMNWLAGKVDIIEGPTNLRNYAIQRGLTSLGWRLVGSRYNYHRWLT